MNGHGPGRPKSTGLSKRQQEIVNLRLQGLFYKECASALGISYVDVRRHMAIVYRRFDVHNVQELSIKMHERALQEIRSDSHKVLELLYLGLYSMLRDETGEERMSA